MRPTNIELMLLVTVAATVVTGCSKRVEMPSDEGVATKLIRLKGNCQKLERER